MLVTTDHGGSARASMERPIATRFDRLRNGNAFGQRAVEGVHGMQELKAHTNTFLLVVVPPHIDKGGEILDDDVKNSDVTATLLEWFGAGAPAACGGPATCSSLRVCRCCWRLLLLRMWLGLLGSAGWV